MTDASSPRDGKNQPYRSVQTWLLYALGLVIVIGVAYAAALRVGFLSDDVVLVFQARQPMGIADIFRVSPTWFFYRPLGKLMWVIETRMFGTYAALYHIVSMAIHWANSLLVMLLARRFMRPATAWLAAALFVASPLYVESVVWLACQYDLLATMGYLAALLGLARWWSSRHVGWYALALVAYQMSVWSKELSFTFPVIAAIVIVAERGRVPWRRLIGALLPFACVLGVNLFQRLSVWGTIGGYPGPMLPDSLPLALGRTALTLLAPLHQMLFPRWLVWLWALLSGALLLCGALLLRDRRPLLLGAAWLVVALIPVVKVLPVGSDLQNSRVLYFPAIGVALMLAASLGAATDRAARAARMGAPAVAIGICVWVVIVQLGPWNVAGANARYLLEEVHWLMPSLPDNSPLEVAGLPDNVQGAYVYRLGFDHVLDVFFGMKPKVKTVAQLSEDVSDAPSSSVQLGVAPDAAGQRWEVVRLRRVDVGDTSADAGAEAWRWYAGRPLSGEWLASPTLPKHTGWAEVLVVVDAGASPEGYLLVGWQGTAQQPERFALRAGVRTYRLFLSPQESGGRLGQLRIAADGAPSVALQAVAVRFIR